jgi:CHASE3 domain sensor protein
MNPETLNGTYEAITNPILRLMLYGFAAIVASLVTAVVYLYREMRDMQREMIEANYEAIHALDRVADSLSELRTDLTAIVKKITQ